MSPELVAAALGAGVAAVCSLMGAIGGYVLGFERRDKTAQITEDRLMDAIDVARQERDDARGAVESLSAELDAWRQEQPANSEKKPTP